MRVFIINERTGKKVTLVVDSLLIALNIFIREIIEVIKVVTEGRHGARYFGLKRNLCGYEFSIFSLHLNIGDVLRVAGHKDIFLAENKVDGVGRCV